MSVLKAVFGDPNAREVKRHLQTVARHHELTGSRLAGYILSDWGAVMHRIVKVMPRDYKRVLNVMQQAEAGGLSIEEAHDQVMVAAHG